MDECILFEWLFIAIGKELLLERMNPIHHHVQGTLPVLNANVIEKAVLAGLALGCQINRHSHFSRKQYFYPDLPKGYQISQHTTPLASSGQLEVCMDDGQSRAIGITRVHIEEDAGKVVYVGSAALTGADSANVDFNRAGVPLLEVVSEPDIRTAAEAAAYGAELRRVLRYIGVSSGNMAEGSLRCDVNVSVRPVGTSALGTKVEIKNLNSFAAVQRAIQFEIDRQVGLICSVCFVATRFVFRWSATPLALFSPLSKLRCQRFVRQLTMRW